MWVALTRQLIVASYIYQDGEAFVRASLAMDAIVQALIDRRAVRPGAIYYLSDSREGGEKERRREGEGGRDTE